METRQSNQKNKKSIAFSHYYLGILFILAGVLIMGKNAGYVDEQTYSILMSWPMIPILIGFHSLLRQHIISGLILIAFGFYFIIPLITWINLTPAFWPILLIGGGIIFIFTPKIARRNKDRFKATASANNSYTNNDGFVYSECLLGGAQQIVTEEVFKGAVIKNTLSGTVLDLRRTILSENETYIDVNCNFGGIEIYIPSNWNVRIEINPFLGGCEDTRILHSTLDMEHTLIIRGNISFGGIEIKN